MVPLRWRSSVATSLATIALGVVSCGDANAPTNVDEQRPVPRDGASYWPGAEWRRAEPAQVGIDGAVISVVHRLQSGAVAGVNALVAAMAMDVGAMTAMTGQSNTHFGAPVQILMRDILPAVREN
jgi:hypothetical protein